MSYNYEKYLKAHKHEATLPGSGEVVEFRALTTNDMKELLVYENQTDPLVGEEILDQILSETALNEDFDVNNLYIQDRYYQFIELRKATKGTKYSFPYTCKKCGNQSIQNIDFNDLEVKEKQDSEKEVKLLDGNLVLEMDHITRGEQKEGYKMIDKSLSPSKKQVEMILSDMAASIKSITTPEGKEEIPMEKKIEFVGGLPSSEYQKIRDWYQKNDFGINLNTKIICDKCEFEEEIQIPLDNFFE